MRCVSWQHHRFRKSILTHAQVSNIKTDDSCWVSGWRWLHCVDVSLSLQACCSQRSHRCGAAGLRWRRRWPVQALLSKLYLIVTCTSLIPDTQLIKTWSFHYGELKKIDDGFHICSPHLTHTFTFLLSVIAALIDTSLFISKCTSESGKLI